MIFLENCLLADNSHEILCLIFSQKLGKILQNLSSAAVVIDAFRVKCALICMHLASHQLLTSHGDSRNN